MAKMYLMCGLSGAGKTTFAKEFATKNHCVYFAIDAYYAPYYLLNKEVYDNRDVCFKVWIKFFEEIHEAEMAGKDVVIDTNAPTFVKRQQFIDWFSSFDEHNLVYIAVSEDLRYKNNRSRERVVPDVEMKRMRQEFEEPVGQIDMKNNTFLFPEKNWDNVIVYVNKDNHFIRCKNSY